MAIETLQAISDKTNSAARTPRSLVSTAGRVLAMGSLTLGVFALSGCKSSFMDPSVTGRHEWTPTIMPILDRISSIEEGSGDVVDYTDPLAEDLIPRPTSYRIGPGDLLQVTIFDIIEPNSREAYEVPVDPRGLIEIPQLGRIDVGDKTTEEAQRTIEETIKARNLIQDPLVQVLATSQRRQTFTVLGAVQSPGLYPIPKADYRVLEALSAAGAFDESINEIYIIRQVPLAEEVTKGVSENREGSTPLVKPENGTKTDQPAQPAPSGDDLLKIIDDIAPEEKKPGSPGAMRSDNGSPSAMQVEDKPTQRPLINLIEDQEAPSPQMSDGSSWIFVNGKWVKVRTATEDEATALGTKADELITQRVIKVKLKDLLAGKQSINLIIRPGDVIRFPAAASGFVYMDGEVNRPGPYQVVPGLTLMRAMSSAGGLSDIAVPSRVDIIRRVGENRQATVRLDYGAIASQTQPDVLLKSDDIIRVGTNFWALPLAVTRNGFRMSYGFGFILDRNLGNDIFGPPPVNSFGN